MWLCLTVIKAIMDARPRFGKDPHSLLSLNPLLPDDGEMVSFFRLEAFCQRVGFYSNVTVLIYKKS